MGNTANNPKLVWVGLIISWLLSANFIFGGVMKIMQPPFMLEGIGKMGIPQTLLLPIGILEITCTLIYLYPRTEILGAILLAGYMGGAIMTHLRVGDPFYMQILIGVLVWVALYVRCPRLRALIPCKCKA